MKKLFLLGILFITAAGFGSAQEINEIPMYGGMETPEMKVINNRFVAEILKTFGTKEAAAADAVKVGWAYMARSDWKMAMKRFNQAWLLNPADGRIYWGFGSAMAYAGFYEEAEKHFSKAGTMLAGDGRFMSDHALFYLYWANNRAKNKIGFGLDYIFKEEYDPKWKADVTGFLDKAVEISERGSQAAPNEPGIYINWAQALYGKGDYKAAWEKVARADELGGKVNPKFLKALNKKMKDPRS